MPPIQSAEPLRPSFRGGLSTFVVYSWRSIQSREQFEKRQREGRFARPPRLLTDTRVITLGLNRARHMPMRDHGQFLMAHGQSSAARMKSAEPIFVTELFCQIHGELLSLLRNLSGDDWSKPTAARICLTATSGDSHISVIMRRWSRPKRRLKTTAIWSIF